ncbi:MAG: discoidin domain-containing protein [Candidatus Omnitrophota bacterium]
MHADECEEKTASGDVTKWASCSQSRGITPTSMQKLSKRISAYLTSRGKFRYHGLARGVFHLVLLATFLLSFPGLATAIRVSVSSLENDSYHSDYLIDDKINTRWSSEFSDPQWVLLDLGSPSAISGLTLHWEQAFAQSYEILLSNDARTFKTVYATDDSDGKTDDIYFKKSTVRYIKILCKKRSTAWGYSLWEIKVKGADEQPAITVSSSRKHKDAEPVMDGNMNTAWISTGGNEEWILIDLRKEKDIGGIQINWGSTHATSYEVYGSLDNIMWKSMYSKKDGNGAKDLLYVPVTRVRFLKIICRQSSGSRYCVKEITLKGQDESASPQKYYEVLAEESPAGYFPKWVYRKQAYWTVVGVDGDERESLLCEDGTIEPYSKSCSLMPYLYIDGKFITAMNSKVTQSLENGYLPIPTVTWQYNGIRLTQKLCAYGERGKSSTFVWYTLENTSQKQVKGKLYLTIRPFQVNPPWHFGGLTELRSLEYDGAVVKANKTILMQPLSKPDNFGAVTFAEGDIINVIREGKLPKNAIVNDEAGYASGALEYNFTLPPRGLPAMDFFYVIPLHGEIQLDLSANENLPAYFNDLIAKTRDYWEEKLSKVQINIPETEIINTLKANLAYILINNDGEMIQPGSRNYKRGWMRDGAVIGAALLRMGHQKEVKNFLELVSRLQYANGMIPFILEKEGMPVWCKDWKEYDSQGEFIYALSEYYKFTKDKVFLSEKFPYIEKALQFLIEIRKQRLSDEFKNGPPEKKIFYGILPQSNSHEGYFPPQHSYWDDFWVLKGWKDAEAIATLLGKDNALQWIKTEMADFKKSLYDSLNLVMQVKHIGYIPGCAEKGDFDPTSTAIAIFPCDEYQNLPKPQISNTFEKYYSETFLPRSNKNWKGSFTPYEIRSVNAFLMMGQKERALEMLRYFLTVMRPRSWNHWAEVVISDYRLGQYVGDMPHTWIGAEYITAVRNLFVYEKEGKLILADGISTSWLEGGEEVSVKNLPTYYGTISYSISYRNRKLLLNIEGDATPPDGFVVTIPFKKAGKKPIEFRSLPYRNSISVTED